MKLVCASVKIHSAVVDVRIGARNAATSVEFKTNRVF